MRRHGTVNEMHRYEVSCELLMICVSAQGLSGEFEAQIALSIREQLQEYARVRLLVSCCFREFHSVTNIVVGLLAAYARRAEGPCDAAATSHGAISRPC